VVTVSVGPIRPVAVLVGLLLIAGCAQADPALPVVDQRQAVPEPPAITVPGDDLEAAAKALHDCLQDHGLPARYAPGPDGRATLVRIDEATPAYWVSPSGDTEQTGALSESQGRVALDRYKTRQDQATPPAGGQRSGTFLFVDGVDRTDVWNGCLDQSGFDDAAVWNSGDNDALDALWENMVVEASNDWARCARDHGLNGIRDAQPATDPNQVAQALVPLTTTEAQLKAVIENCPVVDPGVQAENDRIVRQAIADGTPYADIIDQLSAQPRVSVDGSSLVPGNATDMDAWDHFGRLMEILGYSPSTSPS